MDHKTCFLFGHSTTPHEMLTYIEAAAERHYRQYGIRTFVVGSRGSFDQYATTAIKRLKQRYPDITLLLLLAYHPAERPVHLLDGFDNSYYPPIEHIPRQYAIVKANEHMVDTADSIICYTKYSSNTGRLLAYAQRRQKKTGIPIENLGIDA